MENPSDATATPRDFERKIVGSGRAAWLERVWLRLWLAFAVVGTFLAVSLAGLWPLLGFDAHAALLTAFALALFAAIGFALWVPHLSRSEAIARLEASSGLPHRPASSYEDRIAAGADDPTTAAIWRAHRAKLAAVLGRLRVRAPAPATHLVDPFALRALAALGLILTASLLGDRATDRLASAFHLGAPDLPSDARLDAWVTPPPYTAKAPIMLADGLRPGLALAPEGDHTVEVPEGSLVTLRVSGSGQGQLTVDFTPDASKVATALTSSPVAGATGVAELRLPLKVSGTMVVPGQPAPWTFKVIPDLPPSIILTKEPEPNARGSMKLSYKVEDDYGVVGAQARFAKLPRAADDERTAWARTQVLSGPRPPLDRPPRYLLRLPSPGAAALGKPGEAMTYLELGAHPWAGLRVAMTLEARDAAGQIGRSAPREMELPARRFTKPLARALVEQRRKLVDDPRYRDFVVKALAALMIAPEDVIEPHAYLGMRTVATRLAHDHTRGAVRSSIEQLWHIALRIEDGTLSDAERRMKEAQEKLAKAIDEGASEAELDALMKELRQAMNDYVEQLAKQAQEQPEQDADQNRDASDLGRNDLEAMMRRMEQAAKNGSREQAQQMLSEMRDLMDRLQAQKGQKADREQTRQMQKKMDELGNVIGQQQRLMDDTFSQMKREGDQGRDGRQPGQKGAGKGKPGDKGGEKGQARNGDKGKGRGVPSQKGGEPGQDASEPGDSGETGDAGSSNGLGQRQKALAEQLQQLKDAMRQAGGGGSKEMDEANQAMDEAEQAIAQGALDDATQQQGEALDKMRQGAQKMQQEMAKNGRNKYGENGETPRDPLGRPQKSEGPDAGSSVKVPGEIDMQRAREILQELRKRSAEQTRPPVELDYLERLLKRF